MSSSQREQRFWSGLLAVLLLVFGGRACANEVTASASVRFADGAARAVPDFQKHIVPLLGRLGCNSAKCHGSFQGQGGLRLSLFGFDFDSDYAALTAEASSEEGRRLTTESPSGSLIVQKPTEQIDHEGGKRLEEGSWEHHLLLRWIAGGAKPTPKVRALQRLEVRPEEIVFQQVGGTSQLNVIAVWEDGSREDVTCLCRFRSNDDAVVIVDRDGNAVSAGQGDTHIVAFYDNGVAAVPVMRPVSLVARRNEPLVRGAGDVHPIDRFVSAKLAKLGITPSDTCTDAEFLRRVSIDMTGTLPEPDEVEAFLDNTSPHKRERKIDELLQRTTYAAWWANKLCDFTGCSPTAQSQVLEVAQALSAQWYNWIHKRVAENMPYDKMVEGIVLSIGRRPDQSAEDYAAEMSSYVRRESPANFAQRETMPHYWTRTSVKEPKDKALAFAHSFLGIQLQCAQCHKHPFDQWTQHDFQDFTAFFAGVHPDRGVVGFPEFAAAQAGQVIRWPSLVVDQAEDTTLHLLRSRDVHLTAKDDPRAAIMDWMRDPENPWFARAFVNRVWAGYFHVGIVDPPDQFTPANPPSNPQLLQWLTKGFIDNNFDMKWLHRQIATSNTYQRSWRPNETNRHDHRNFSRAIPRRIPAEVVYDAIKQATAANDELDEVRTNLKRRASGHLSMRMAGTYAMNVFGKPERSLNCDCERVNSPTLLQAVFLQNDPLVRMRLADSGWLAEIAEAADRGTAVDSSKLVRQVWLRTVNRLPTDAECERAQEHLASAESLADGMSDLLWAMLNTKEFLLNH